MGSVVVSYGLEYGLRGCVCRVWDAVGVFRAGVREGGGVGGGGRSPALSPALCGPLAGST